MTVKERNAEIDKAHWGLHKVLAMKADQGFDEQATLARLIYGLGVTLFDAHGDIQNSAIACAIAEHLDADAGKNRKDWDSGDKN